MNSFGMVLKQCIEEQGISVNNFTKITGLNRGWLYNVFSGVKKLPEEKFQAILQSINFSSANEESLREAYYREVFGNSEFNNLNYIINFFNNHYEENYDFMLNTANCFMRPDTASCLVDENNFMNALRNIVNVELESNAKPVVYTNYPYTLTNVDNYMYAVLSGDHKESILYHILCFESNNSTENNIRNILHSLRYIKLRQNIHYYYSNTVINEITGLLYPFYVITASGALLFDSSDTRGLFIHNEPDTLAGLCAQAKNMISKCKTLATFPKNVWELKDIVEPQIQKLDLSYIQHFPCLAPFANAEVLDKIMNPELPFRESVVQIVQRYYSVITSNNPLNFFTLSGVVDFVKDGRILDAPEEIIIRLPVPLRVYILEKLYNYMKDNADIFFLVDERKINIPKNLKIAHSENSVTILTTVSDEPDDYVGECVIHLDDNSIAADFQHFQDYIVRNGFLHGKDYVLNYLSDLLVLCKQMERST